MQHISISCRFIFSSLILVLLISVTNAQETTYDDYTGTWQDAGSWDVGPPTMPYNVNGGTVTIQGNISSTAALVFDKGTLIISDYDTLIIHGDLTIGNNANLTIEDWGILIVYGDMYVFNKVEVEAGGYLVVTGDLSFTGSGNQGSFTSTQDPAQVYVGGTVTPPNNVDYENFPVLECETNDHNHTGCSYGDLIDGGDSGIGDLIQDNCTTDPQITAIASNSPIDEGNPINLTTTADEGTGTAPVTYYWEGPDGYTSDTEDPSIAISTLAMDGYYVLSVFNDEGCSVKDSVDVVINSNCCGGFSYYSNDDYTGTWNDVGAWASPNDAWRPLPPPTDPMNTQPNCINGYITLNDDLTLDGGELKICDTLVITGSLHGDNITLTVEPTGVLIVLTDFDLTNGSITNNGDIIFAGDFETPYDLGGSGQYYVFDDTPTVPVWFSTPTDTETDLSNNDSDLYTFYTQVACGSFSGGTIATAQSLCSGDDVAAFTSSADASSGAFTYQWYLSTDSSDPSTGTWTAITGATGTTHDHGTLTQTTYFYREAIKGAGCSVNSNVLTITVNALPTPTINSSDADNTICEGGTVTLDAGAGYSTYSWSSGGSAQTEDITNGSDLSALLTVAVTVTVTDGNGCEGTSPSVDVNIYPTPETGPTHHIESGFAN